MEPNAQSLLEGSKPCVLQVAQTQFEKMRASAAQSSPT
jgi:hypothetical protein